MAIIGNKNMRDKWCLITTYKNNYDLMESFVNFYRQIWGINKYYFIIGVIKKDDDFHNAINKINNLNKQGDVNIEYILYDTANITHIKIWGQYKQIYFAQLNNEIPVKYNRILNIDNDEFYYIKDREVVIDNDELHFHFVEYIPQIIFDINKDFNWSLQGWFYRVNYFLLGNEMQIKRHIPSPELEILRRDIINSKKIKITHQWCKKLKFKRKYILSPWRHKDHGSVCQDLIKLSNIEDIVEYLKSSYFCYHIGVPDLEFLEKRKTKWNNPETNRPYMQAGDIEVDIKSYFEKYYSRPFLNDIFKDNYLKIFWSGANR